MGTSNKCKQWCLWVHQSMYILWRAKVLRDDLGGRIGHWNQMPILRDRRCPLLWCSRKTSCCFNKHTWLSMQIHSLFTYYYWWTQCLAWKYILCYSGFSLRNGIFSLRPLDQWHKLSKLNIGLNATFGNSDQADSLGKYFTIFIILFILYFYIDFQTAGKYPDARMCFI